MNLCHNSTDGEKYEFSKKYPTKQLGRLHMDTTRHLYVQHVTHIVKT